MMNYKALTTRTLDNIPMDDINNGIIDEEAWLQAKMEEQDEELAKRGFSFLEDYTIHYLDSFWSSEKTVVDDINNAIQCLAIKDGVDLVEWENGNIGFIASYNGKLNGFEIIA